VEAMFESLKLPLRVPKRAPAHNMDGGA
jgi:hypothetical protein